MKSSYRYHSLASGRLQFPTHKMRSPSKLMYLSLFILVTGVMLCVLNIYQLHRIKEDHLFHHAMGPHVEGTHDESKLKSDKPVAWVAGKNLHTGYLKHVFDVLGRVGFITGDDTADWSLLWSHDYPFKIFAQHLSNLKPYQRVNHFPGSGYITNKASLATSKMEFIPRAFKLPDDKDKFLSFSQDHPDVMWVQKSNTHRGIQIRNTSDLDLSREGSFLQEYVSKPFLIDKHKFDIGVYTILTSINPLRVYIVQGDILFRFCPEEYYPFDPQNRDKYVVGDDYLPMWKVPSLKDVYETYGYSFKDTFNHYMESKGLDHEKIWRNIRSAIATVYLEKEDSIVEAASVFPSTNNFFEMVRFDFVVDEALNVFLMEANMSPNLSSSHFPPNKRLYEHVIFNALGLIGLTQWLSRKQIDYEDDLRVSSVDINVYPEVCARSACSSSCTDFECRLCKHCQTEPLQKALKRAYLEHIARGSCRRVFPPAINRTEALSWDPKSSWPGTNEMAETNSLMYRWFVGMCRKDPSWC